MHRGFWPRGSQERFLQTTDPLRPLPNSLLCDGTSQRITCKEVRAPWNERVRVSRPRYILWVVRYPKTDSAYWPLQSFVYLAGSHRLRPTKERSNDILILHGGARQVYPR